MTHHDACASYDDGDGDAQNCLVWEVTVRRGKIDRIRSTLLRDRDEE